MRVLIVIGACVALLHSLPVRADCTLAFAPPEIRQAASEHYYRSFKRDATPPGRLPSAERHDEVRNPETGNTRSDNVRNLGAPPSTDRLQPSPTASGE
ncbi:hypothetical protein HIV01_000035 [Lysobacter arenosi]|uniref:Uncharacterized protein n=1 Tax=Lysobacter arenosi TaxID=2795387 RepID=A0ABX7RDN8_9GAMM|nr:hypothetical protein [Lysobacter arenosi]QSX75011.1 hypothetical protein HIV01_000035 [Lysobacter arenosi]